MYALGNAYAASFQKPLVGLGQLALLEPSMPALPNGFGGIGALGDVPVYSGPTLDQIQATNHWDGYSGLWVAGAALANGRPPSFSLATNNPNVWIDPNTQATWVTPGYGSFDPSVVFGTNKGDPNSAYHLPSGIFQPVNAALATITRILSGQSPTLGTEPTYASNGNAQTTNSSSSKPNMIDDSIMTSFGLDSFGSNWPLILAGVAGAYLLFKR